MQDYGRRRGSQFVKYATWHKVVLNPSSGLAAGIGERDYHCKSRRRPFKKQARADGKREIERQCLEMGRTPGPRGAERGPAGV